MIEKEFKEKLRKRVIGKLESHIFGIRLSQACIREDKGWFLSLPKDSEMSLSQKDWPEIQKACRKKVGKLKDSIRKNWPEMMVHLSLRAPGIREDRILSDRDTCLMYLLQILYPVLPILLHSKEERKAAAKIYIEELSKVSLEGSSSKEFKKRLTEGKSLKNWFEIEAGSFKNKGLTAKDSQALKEAVQKLREKSEDHYYEIVYENPCGGSLFLSPLSKLQGAFGQPVFRQSSTGNNQNSYQKWR